MAKKHKLSIYLLKEELSPEDCLTEDTEVSNFDKVNNWKIIIKTKPKYEPEWSSYLGLNIKLVNASAILFILFDKRWFAITFNYAHYLLDKSKLITDFGLITALNMLDPNKIKSSDVFAPSDHSKQRRTQTTQYSNLYGHGMDSCSNILKNITGRVQDEYEKLSKSISATHNSIKINTTYPVEHLNNLCKDLFDIYSKKDYCNNFPEIFNIQEIKDICLINKLNAKLLNSVNNREGIFYLEIPELIDFHQIDHYQINVKDHKQHNYEEISISNFFESIQDKVKITVENLKKWQLFIIDQSDRKIKSFSIFDCFVFDCDIDNVEFHLSHGKWYSLSHDFSEELQKINENRKEKINGEKIPNFKFNNEGEYNQVLADHLSAHCLDKQCIPMGGYDKIEPCDVLCISQDDKNIFIHVKIKHGGSSGLSHLFEQGDVSLILLNKKDQKFINGIRKKVSNFNSENVKIIHYLIIGDPLKKLPLFARICLFKYIKSIESRGATVYWSIVPNLSK